MGYEDTHPDVVQNIEVGIVTVYRDCPRLSDYQVMDALDALIMLYRVEIRGHAPKQVSLEAAELDVFETAKAICEWRMGRGEQLDEEPLFPEAQRDLDVVLGCLRKVRKSVGRWNNRFGPTGYLQFVSQYVW